MKENRFLLYVCIFLFFASFYSIFSIGHYGGDGYDDYLTAESIVLDRNIVLHDRPDDPDELGYKPNAGIRGRDGKMYSSRSGLGVPVLLAVFYAVGHIVSLIFDQFPHDLITIFFASFYNPVISALTALLIFITSRRLNFRPGTSFTLAVIYSLATMAAVYTRTGFEEPTLALFLLLSIYWLVVYSNNPKVRYIIFSAFCAAYCVFVKAIGLIYIPCLIIYLVWVEVEKRQRPVAALQRVMAYIGATLFVCIGALSYNFFVHGSTFTFGGHNLFRGTTRILCAPHFLKGLYYYLLSTGKGFFLFNIPLILSFIGFFKAPKERRKEAVLFCLIFAVNLLVFAKSFRRGSLFAWGPRYLLPSVPVLVFLIGDFYEHYRPTISRLSTIVFSALGFVVMLPCMFINQSKFYLFVKNELALNEYMINFIPDLSPIKGAWHMLISRLASEFLNRGIPFVYRPDYRLVPEIVAKIDEYNYFDLWFIKIIDRAPNYQVCVYAMLGMIVLLMCSSLLVTLKNIRES